MSPTPVTGFPLINDELEYKIEVLADCSLLQAAINKLKKVDPDDEVALNLEALLVKRYRNPIQVVVTLRDLLVHRVASNTAIQLIVLDDDVEGLSEEDYVERPNLDGESEDFLSSPVHTAEVLPEQVTRIFEAVKAEGGL